MKSMKSAPSSSIEVDKAQVLEQIKKKGKYKTDRILIKKWQGGSGKESFVTEIKNPKSSFIGVLNSKLEREGYGINNLANGDKYFGYFESDQRSKDGIYIWAPEKKDDTIKTEYYYGFWENDKKEKNGIYMWLEESADDPHFETSNFDAYVGEINEAYRRGTYMSKVGDDYYVYHGNFDREGRKSDDNAYFYSSKNDRLIHGKILKNNFVSGYVSFFDSESGLLKDLASCLFDKDGNITSITYQDDLQRDERQREENAITLFRNIILDVDYFGEIYSKFKDIQSFIQENMGNSDIFNDKRKFPEINELCSAYNTNNVYFDLEEKAFGAKK